MKDEGNQWSQSRLSDISQIKKPPSFLRNVLIETGQLTSGLVFTVIEPFGESLFFISVISCLQIKVLLIVDLDNPFAAGEEMSSENIPLCPWR